MLLCAHVWRSASHAGSCILRLTKRNRGSGDMAFNRIDPYSCFKSHYFSAIVSLRTSRPSCNQVPGLRHISRGEE
jgi:hypothetical protein